MALKDRLNRYRRGLCSLLTRPAVVLVTLLICITQEVFVILELWEPCLNRIILLTHEDEDTPVLLPAVTIGVRIDDYLDYLLNSTQHENHHPFRDEHTEETRQLIKSHMIDCIGDGEDFDTDSSDRHQWCRCMFSVSHQLNISIHDMFDSLLFHDWSHDYLFKLTAWLDNRIYSLRSMQGYLGIYMVWTFFTDTGTTRYSTSELIYNQTSGVKGEVFNTYIPISNGLYLVLKNADQAVAEQYFFKYYSAIHSPAILYKMDDNNIRRFVWDSSKDYINLPLIISHNILTQKKCNPDDGARGSCRDYLPSLDGNRQVLQNTSLDDDIYHQLSNWQCNLDPSLYTCYTRSDCEKHLFFSNPGYTCLQDNQFMAGIPFHHFSLLSPLTSSKGVACVDEDDSPSNADAAARNQYLADHTNVEVCPRPCHVPVHRIEVPYTYKVQSDEPTMNFIIHKSKEETFLTVELYPPTTWVQLLVNIFCVAGTWYGLSFYGGLINAPVWLSASWKYVTDRGIGHQVNLKKILTSSANYFACFDDRVCFKVFVIDKSSNRKADNTSAGFIKDHSCE